MESIAVRVGIILAISLLTTFVLGDTDTDTGSETVVVVQEAEEECERRTQDGDYLVINYVGKYTDDGEEFDDSESKTDPFYFKLGEGKVLPAWERSLKDMCVGEKREITIPPNELEGHPLPASGAAVPDAARGEVIYHIELIKIMDKPPTPNLFKKMDFDGDKRISKTEMKAFFTAQGLGGLKDDETLDSAVDNIFDFQDKDKDSWISFEEFPGQKHDEL